MTFKAFLSAFSVTALATLSAPTVTLGSDALPSRPSTQVTGPVDYSAATALILNQDVRIAASKSDSASITSPARLNPAAVPPADTSGWGKAGSGVSGFVHAMPPTEPPMVFRLRHLAVGLSMDESQVEPNGASKPAASAPSTRRRMLDRPIHATGWPGNVIGRARPEAVLPGAADPEVDPLPPLIDAPPTGL